MTRLLLLLCFQWRVVFLGHGFLRLVVAVLVVHGGAGAIDCCSRLYRDGKGWSTSVCGFGWVVLRMDSGGAMRNRFLFLRNQMVVRGRGRGGLVLLGNGNLLRFGQHCTTFLFFREWLL